MIVSIINIVEVLQSLNR